MERDWASYLRTLADFYEMHPETPSPTLYGWSADVHIGLDKDKAKEYLQSIGSFEKKFYGETFSAIKKLNDGEVVLNFSTVREAVCRKVVKGKRIIEEQYVPGHIEPAREEEIVEWECDEPILAPMNVEETDTTPPNDIAAYEGDSIPF